jgi:hypothetical protein
VSDGGFASVMQLDKALDRYTNQVAHVVIRNHARSKDFSQLEASPAMNKLRALSGAVVDLPELDANAMYKIDMGGLSYWAGAHVNEGETALKPLERERLQASDFGLQTADCSEYP